MEVKLINKQKQEMAFRIVKDRWYHNIFDRFSNFVRGSKEDAPAYYQIHLSAELTKKKNKWILNNQKHLKTRSITPDASFHRQFATRMADPNLADNFFDENGIAPFGFEIDMSHVGDTEETPTQEVKLEKEKIEEKVETKEDTSRETIPNPEAITDLSDIPIDVLLKMCSDPEMMELVLKLDPSLDVLEAMVYEVLEMVQMMKEEKFLKEKEKSAEEEKGEKPTPEFFYP